MKKHYKSTTKSGNALRKTQWTAFLAITLLMLFSAKSYAQVSPTSVTCTATPTSVTINWSGGSGAYVYYVQLDQEPNFVYWWQGNGVVGGGQVSGSTNTYTLTSGIVPGQTYYAHVAAVNSGWGWNSVSTSLGITVPIPYFTVTQDIGTTLLLSWQAVSGANQYTMQYRPNSGGPWTGVPCNGNTSVKVTGLQPNTSYDYRLAVYKNGTFFEFTTPETWTTANPVEVYPNYNIGTTLQLNWQHYAWASSYAILYRPDGWGQWLSLPTGTNSAKLTNLLPAQGYQYQLRIYKNGTLWGTTPIGNFWTSTVSINKSQDIGTTAMIQMNFNDFNPWDASKIIFQYRRIGYSNWTGISGTYSADRIKLNNLTPNTEYEWKISVFRNNVLWGVTGTDYFYTGNLGIYAGTDNGTSLDLQWDGQYWANSYTLQYSLPAMTNWVTMANLTNNWATITPILANQDYYARVLVYSMDYNIWSNTLWGSSKETLLSRSGKSQAMTDNVNLSANLDVYPNPCVDQMNLRITATESSNCTWSLYDMTGKQVSTGTQDIQTGDNTLNIDATQLNKGVYMLTTIIGSEKHDFRILKQ
jgi:hypothetical protein